jgi:alpha-tubulin suppressor-like RCC1 family protein
VVVRIRAGCGVSLGRRSSVKKRLALVLAIVGVLSQTAAQATSTGPMSWGRNDSGQLGRGTVSRDIASPGAIRLSGRVVALYSAGNTASFAETTDRTVWAWGGNLSGQLGPGGVGLALSATPVAMQGLCTTCGLVAQLASGENNAFVLFSGGQVQGWGENTFGSLGNGTGKGGADPTFVQLTSAATAVAAGGDHGLALMRDGTVDAWGQNDHGQLGNGTNTNSSVPVRVAGISDAIAVSAGNLYSMALLANGSVVGWGYNAWGQLGDGTTRDRATPTPALGLRQPAIAISAGGNVKGNGHALALMRDGTVMAWGHNASGELGNGTKTNSSVPVAVTGLTGVVRVAAGGGYSAALLRSGQVAVWGDNSYGELGIGTEGGRVLTPQLVPNLSGVTIVSAGPPGHLLTE